MVAPTISLHDFVTVSQAADILGVASATLRHWDRTGKLAAFRHPVNGYRLYRRTDLETLLQQLASSKGLQGYRN